MLTHLHIRDYALIEQAELTFSEGLTVLTGETGAGKSILIEALGLALGDRADTGVIRTGARRAEITATVQVGANAAAAQWLEAQAFDDGDECLLRRTISDDGRSKAFINGSPVNLTALRELGGLLIDIHGQHEHHSLLGRDHQAGLLDGFANHPALLGRIRQHWREWKRLQQEIAELETLAGGDRGQLDLLRYQAEELDALGVGTDELNKLDAEHRRLAGAGELIALTQGALEALQDGDAAISDRLGRVIGELQGRRDLDRGLDLARELLDGAAIQINEAAAELRSSLDRLHLDPERLDQVERRLAAIHDLARKHRVRAGELPELHRHLQQQLEAATGADARLAELVEARAQLEQAWRDAAVELGDSRARAARRLSREVTREMRRLGMPQAEFTVTLEPRGDDTPSPAGRERALFQVTTNPSQPPKPLAKVASGGELSRMGLAIQMITARQIGVPTIIFDEVDVGIGGRVAEIVGQGLRTLGGRRQVLCITHLPQVAALGHHHLQITKSTRGKTTRIAIQRLERDQRSEEVARMLGGIEISATTREHADEMLRKAEETA